MRDFHSLCDISPIPEEVSMIKDLKGDNFAHTILRCLKIVDKEHDHPRQLSKNITQRVNQTSQLVARCRVRKPILRADNDTTRKLTKSS